MRVPTAEGEFDKAHAVLDQTTGQEAAFAETRVAVDIAHQFRLFAQVEGCEVFAVHQSDRLLVDVAVGSHLFGRIFLMKRQVHHLCDREAFAQLDVVDTVMAVDKRQSVIGTAQMERFVF